jgi:hypothetical protein
MFELIVHYALGNIPDWVWPAGAGAAFVIWFFAGVITHLPQIAIYGKFVKPVAFISLLVCVFMYGGQGVVAVYKADLADAQHKADIADEKAKAANQSLKQALDANAHLIKGRAYGVAQIIEKDRTKIDADCARINHDAWEDYNRAIKNTGSKQ